MEGEVISGCPDAVCTVLYLRDTAIQQEVVLYEGTKCRYTVLQRPCSKQCSQHTHHHTTFEHEIGTAQDKQTVTSIGTYDGTGSGEKETSNPFLCANGELF